MEIPAVFIGYVFVLLGLILGSFGNVVIARLPEGRSFGGRSECPRCNKTLRARELIPILSFALQRGRCRGCGAPIAWQYPLVEISSALLFLLALAHVEFVPFPALALGIAFLAMLLVVVIDTRTQMIPDILTLVLATSALSYRALLSDLTLMGALPGVVFLGALFLLSRGRWVGSGDIFLVGALGFLFPSALAATVMLLCAYILGGTYAAYILLRDGTHARGRLLPFGPFLVLGAFFAFFLPGLLL